MSHFKGIMRNKKGLTLVEVVVAMALFAIIVPTVLYALETALHINIVSEEFTDANYLAQTEMENIYALSSTYTAVKVLDTLGYGSVCASGDYCRTDGGIQYNINLETHATVMSIQMVQLTVLNTKGERAQIELYLRFGSKYEE